MGKTIVVIERWYILSIFSIMTMFQCAVWNTWGPVEPVALVAFPSWTDSTIGFFANWGNIGMYIGFLPFMILLQRSLRYSVLISGLLVAIGASIKCIGWFHMKENIFTIICHIAAFLNSLAGIVLCSAPPLLSAVWFPPEERVTATCIGQTLNGLGGGVSYFIANIFVSQNIDNQTDISDKQVEYRKELNDYIWVLAGPTIALLFFTLLHFPSKPSTPPSLSSQDERLAMLPGLVLMIKNKSFLLLLLAYSISQGVSGMYGAIMAANLKTFRVNGQYLSETYIGTLGVTTSVVSTFGGLIAARLTDKIQGHMKVSILGLLVIATLIYTILSLLFLKVFELPSFLSLEVSIFALLVLGNGFCQSSCPLFTELCAEICFPASELLVGGAIFLGFGTVSFIFLSVFSIPGIGIYWLNFVLPASSFLPVLLVLLVKGSYPRLQIDLNGKI
ncbi:disrupted in renal carcinoma protein 2 homolog [Eurytemora carolleeae]|uniref:disrupted in renal carcinoma protein 2 homolog n=1 Tax=Eurytemora carolleeae TaxID=1294199 RepID=UPI000C794C49|nr:disrupted in renal carcinoma protein 2 homolog [Eurytemora carolleeae]|eukprot:XP_023345230.1 disrupted in renal carcinoma protein 2 homolog [Eurytemora affinis]